jgi:hypothetical protein
LISGLKAANTCDNLLVFVNQDRIGPSKLQNAIGDLANLFFRMRASITARRPQLGQAHDFNLRRSRSTVLRSHGDLVFGSPNTGIRDADQHR